MRPPHRNRGAGRSIPDARQNKPNRPKNIIGAVRGIPAPRAWSVCRDHVMGSDIMDDEAIRQEQESQNQTQQDQPGNDRRGFLKCMAWAGTGVLWTLSGGIPRSIQLGGGLGSGLLGGVGSAEAAQLAAAGSGFTFLQVSDSHIGLN